ncbi:MAG TPA: GNAT family N-acetyltransferase [Ktedonobacteraceae bacterium]|nr:GNAT family N-acetyltransferase [Ktedonobacteraceae bacterium]
MEHNIQSYLRHAATRGRDIQRIGPFLATFTPHSTNPFLNYAIPDEGTSPSPEDIASLIRVYQQQKCIPRLEYLPRRAPAVEPALLAAGFHVEERMPLMICLPERLHHPPLPAGIELLTPTTDAEILALVTAQNEAYGEAAPEPDVVGRQRTFLEAGGIALLARDSLTGDEVGGGICNVPFDQTTELSSVGVRVPYRRRGIAAALTAQLVQLAWAAGISTVFLMAAHEAEARVYGRVGFQHIGEVLDIRLS